MDVVCQVLIPGPDYQWTRDFVAEHVAGMLAGREEREREEARLGLPPRSGPGFPVDDEAIYKNAVFAVTDGCQLGPWDEWGPWEQETAVAVAQRTARAMLDPAR